LTYDTINTLVPAASTVVHMVRMAGEASRPRTKVLPLPPPPPPPPLAPASSSDPLKVNSGSELRMAPAPGDQQRMVPSMAAVSR
jgi:hypothetical protein